jgi:hypothetical protein
MATPTFDDLTPPDGLAQQWMRGPISLPDLADWAYREGARYGWEARPLWPEPITDRPPTEADADDRSHVQVLHHCGTWGWDGWNSVAAKSRPWQHTPRWQPRQPSLQEQALNELRSPHERTYGLVAYSEGQVDVFRRALEQAGEGKA